MKVLDTDHCVAVLRGRLDLRPLVRPDEALAATTITIGELVYGAYKSTDAQGNLARLDAFLAGLNLLSFDEASARRYGMLRAKLEMGGLKISDLDLQIASIALEVSAPLVTHNQVHVQRLTEVGGLALEDWL